LGYTKIVEVGFPQPGDTGLLEAAYLSVLQPAWLLHIKGNNVNGQAGTG
jgi:hypothetical protein